MAGPVPIDYTIELTSYGLKVKWVLVPPAANAAPDDASTIGKRIDTSKYDKVLIESSVTANINAGITHILDQSFNEDALEQGGDAHTTNYGPSYPYKKLLMDSAKPWVGPRFGANTGIHTFIFHCFF